MRTRATMTVSLPQRMIQEVERIRKTEHRTRSELVREALRVYMNRMRALSVYTPAQKELREIEKGRAELRRGESYTLNELFPGVEGQRRKTSAKSRRSRTSRASEVMFNQTARQVPKLPWLFSFLELCAIILSKSKTTKTRGVHSSLFIFSYGSNNA